MGNSGDKMENIIIIGAGPAGISAALYAARGNLTPLLLNNGIGALAKAEKIENYYGLERPLSGEELYERGVAQAKALGIRIIDAQVLGINGFDTFTVQTTAESGLHRIFREFGNLKAKVSVTVRSVMRFSTETAMWR